MRERREGSNVKDRGTGVGATTVLTLGSGQHGRGQLTLAGLQVAEDEPAGEAVAHDGVQRVAGRFSSWKCCLQYGQPGVRRKKSLL